MSSFSEQYKDPRWQKKRLRILELANWKCERCCRKEKELHVHHLYYESNKKPWEYPDAALVCLCDDCHLKIHRLSDQIKDLNQHFIKEWCAPVISRRFNAEHILEYMQMMTCMDDEIQIQSHNAIKSVAGLIQKGKWAKDG